MQDTLVMENKTKPVRNKLSQIVSELINGHSAFTPNPEDPDPQPWPWRHVLNRALDRVRLENPGSLVALNPQPLPPRLHFSMALAQAVVERAMMMKEIADGLSENGEERSIIIVGGYLGKFTDELCPTPPVIRFPRRGPWPPEPDPRPEWSGLELAVIGAHFQNEAGYTDNKSLSKMLNEAGEKLLKAAEERMY